MPNKKIDTAITTKRKNQQHCANMKCYPSFSNIVYTGWSAFQKDAGRHNVKHKGGKATSYLCPGVPTQYQLYR